MNTETYIVRLSPEERQQPGAIVKKLNGTSQKVKTGYRAAQGGCRWSELDQ